MLIEPPSTLLSVPISILADPARHLHDVASSHSLQHAFDLLADTDLIALPVYLKEIHDDDERGSSDGEDLGAFGVRDEVRGKTYVGMLSVLDILIFYLETINAPHDDSKKRNPLDAPVSEALGSSREGRRFWVAWEGATLGDAAVALTEGVHRLFVPVDVDGRVTYDVVSQLDVVGYLYNRVDADPVVKSKAESSLIELGIVVTQDDKERYGVAQDGTPVISIEKDWRISKALQLMASNSLQAVAILNGKNDNTLFSTLSLSDLRRTRLHNLVNDPDVVEFLMDSHRVDSVDELPQSITVQPRDLLVDAMRLVSKHRVHRVWVTDDDGAVVDVVTLTNMIQALVWPKDANDE